MKMEVGRVFGCNDITLLSHIGFSWRPPTHTESSVSYWLILQLPLEPHGLGAAVLAASSVRRQDLDSPGGWRALAPRFGARAHKAHTQPAEFAATGQGNPALRSAGRWRAASARNAFVSPWAIHRQSTPPSQPSHRPSTRHPGPSPALDRRQCLHRGIRRARISSRVISVDIYKRVT